MSSVEKYITIDKDIVGGTPVFKGTRVTVKTLFDYLEEAARAYHRRFGLYPSTPRALMERGIIPELPQDPFGIPIYFNFDGTITLNGPNGTE